MKSTSAPIYSPSDLESPSSKQNLFLDAANELMTKTMFWPHPNNPFKANIGEGDPRIVLVVGDNTSGKSFFVDNLRRIAADMYDDVSTISISIRERTGSGLSEMAGIRRAMMFGDESEQSTGAVSAAMVKKSFANMESRLQDGKRVILVLDEPEMGLSENFHRAVGELIAKETTAMSNPGDFSVLVVTHSRKLGAGLLDTLAYSAEPVVPTSLVMGDYPNLASWFADDRNKSVDELLALHDKGRDNFRAVLDTFEVVRNARVKKEGPSV